MKELAANNQTFKEGESSINYHINEIKKAVDKAYKELNIEAIPNNSETLDTNKDNDWINKSFIGSDFWDYFEILNSVKKLAISILFFNYTIISAATSILFIFYGDYLLNKYDIENKYPRIGKIIQLRKRFQIYYLILSFVTIGSASIIQIIFSLLIITT